MATSVMDLATRSVTKRHTAPAKTNVGQGERWASAVGGALVALYGARGKGAFEKLVLPLVGGLLVYRGLEGHCAVYEALGVDTAEPKPPQTAVEAGTGVKVEKSITIERPVADVYRLWRNLDQLPRFMHHLEEVTPLTAKRSHWVARAPLGMKVEWDAEIINERPDELIAWRSVEGADVDTAGSVHFQPGPGGRGTEVRVVLKYAPPAGKLGATLASWLGASPEQEIQADLARAKQLLEAGEVANAGEVSARAPKLQGATMAATCWWGKHDVRVVDVPLPRIINPRDAIVRITTTAICGSDLHLYDGFIPTMQRGDVLGHEFMGEVVEVGPAVTNLRTGDRVVVPFTIACGRCRFCQDQLWSLCDNSNPNAWMAEKLYGYSGSGLFGYSHIYGGYAGGQAQYARVPFADVGPCKVPSTLSDEQVLFLSDIFPTGYMAAENCDIEPGDVVAVWGCGPVGLFCIRSAFLLGAERVLAIDFVEGRLEKARQQGAETVHSENEDVLERLHVLTGGRGPDACIDAVGLEAHGGDLQGLYDRARTTLYLATDRPTALRQAIMACKKGGTVSVPGVYGGLLDKLPFGAAFAKGLQFRLGQTHVHRYMGPLLERIEGGEIDPSFVITHRFRLEDAPKAYDLFLHQKDECVKVVLKP